jgi:hypothetical protein
VAEILQVDAQPVGAEGVPTRGYKRPAALGALLAGAVFASFIFTDPLLDAQRKHSAYRVATYSFYDLQAHSLLHFRWNVPTNSLRDEGFVVHGKTFMYFGPFPALLRLPVAILTRRFDGHLSPLSMLLAFAVLMFFTARLASRLRGLIPDETPVTRGEQWVIALFMFAVGAGSVVIFLASRSWVYHEAELWAAALALGAFDFVIAFTTAPSIKNLVLTSAFTTATILTRGVTAIPPLIALAILCVVVLSSRGAQLVGLSKQTFSVRLRVQCVAAVALPVFLYSAVNYAKFGTLYSIPWMAQISRYFPGNAALLAHNGGSMLGLRFIPETFTQYLRPDAVRFSAWFPWLSFGPAPHTFALYQPTSSLTVTMPAFLVLACVGAVGALKGTRLVGSRLAVLRAPLVGACAGAIATLSFGVIEHRYLTDFLPGLVVASLAGLHLTLRWSSARSKRVARLVWIALGALCAVGIWSSSGLAILYARTVALHTPQSSRDGFLHFQRRIGDFLTVDRFVGALIAAAVAMMVVGFARSDGFRAWRAEQRRRQPRNDLR